MNIEWIKEKKKKNARARTHTKTHIYTKKNKHVNEYKKINEPFYILIGMSHLVPTLRYLKFNILIIAKILWQTYCEEIY